MEQLSREQMHDILYKMCVARAFEERVLDMFSQGKIHGTTHLSIGEEASAVGAISVLRPDDIIMSGHRGHSHMVAKGADVNLMMAELLGKKAGYCKWRERRDWAGNSDRNRSSAWARERK